MFLKRIPWTEITLAVILALAVGAGFNFTQPQKYMSSHSSDPYEKEWKKIDSLEQQGLPRSALDEVLKLYERARTENNPAQIVKTVIYREKYQMQLEEDGYEKTIQRLEAELAGEDFPVRPVLQSLLGEMYQVYLDNNYWRLADRTEIAEYRPEDLQTWTAEQLSDRVDELYVASLSDGRLAEVPIENFGAITTQAVNTDELRPTLYDFLAHRAVDQFANERHYLTSPAYAFTIRGSAPFAPAADFVSHQFSTRDTTSREYRALLLFQDLLGRHLRDADPAALIDVDLKRLKFVYERTADPEKDTLFFEGLRNLEGRYPEHPSVAMVLAEEARWHYRRGQNYEPFTAEQYRWELREAHNLCRSCIEKYPDSYGAAECRQLLAGIESRTLKVSVEQVNLPDQPLLAAVEYRNLPQVFLRLIRLSEEDADRLDNPDRQAARKFLLGLPHLREWSVALPAPGDYQGHRTEIKIDDLPLGYYVLLFDHNKDFEQSGVYQGTAFFQVSRIAYFDRKDQANQAEFLVVDRETGAPLERVLAEFFVSRYNSQERRSESRSVGRAFSDQNGFVRPQGLKNNTYYQVRFSKGEDVLHFRSNFSNYAANDARRISRRTFFFLDRAIYRPGQTVYFKGVALELDSDGKPRILPDEEVTVTFYDVNNQEVEKMSLRSNEYGSFNGAFRAPGAGLRGQMSLVSSIGNTRKTFRVEEYKRPRFEVTLAPLAGTPALGEAVTVDGQARTFAGSNVDGAEVRYRVVRETRFPWWPVWSWRGGWPPFRAEDMEIANGVTTTDAEGNFSITFTAVPDASIPADRKPAFDFHVYADVTDITGETQSDEKYVRLAYLGLTAGIRFPEQADRNQLPPLLISTANLDGEPLPAQGQAMIYRLAAPERVMVNRYWQRPDQYSISEADFRRDFPHFAYGDEDQPASWPRAERVWESPFNTATSGELQPDGGAWPVGHYEIVVQTSDRQGNPVETRQIFRLYDADAGLVPANLIGWQDLPDRNFEPGQTASLLLATGADELRVLCELERDKGILRSEWQTVRKWTKLSHQVSEQDRGNLHYLLTYVKHNRSFGWQGVVNVPWSNKELTIEYATFRDKLRPGDEEEWRLTVKGPGNERMASEMVAALYDASLDQFAAHDWFFNPYRLSSYATRSWSPNFFSDVTNDVPTPSPSAPADIQRRSYRQMEWFNFFRYTGRYGGLVQARSMQMAPAAPMAEESMGVSDLAKNAPPPPPPPPPPPGEPEPEAEEQGAPEPQVRTNLDETVFFMPDLRTDEQGNVVIAFRMNEALTRWKFLGMAHTKDLAIGLTQKEVVTQKELMVLPNPPRFLREGDAIEFTAKVSNLSEASLSGTATLEWFNTLTNQPAGTELGLTRPEVSFNVPAGQSARLAWRLKVPKGKDLSLLTHRVIARAGTFSDGEENTLPVLTNRMLVTETMPMSVRGGKTESFTFDRLREATSTTLDHQDFRLEFTSNPAWYAVKALPYLMEYPHECAEQVFSRYYANSLAAAVANSNPRIREIFDRWKGSEAALVSQLLRNQDLKSVLIEETPWVLQAQSESEQRKRIGLLFDLQRMSDEQSTALTKLAAQQLPGGGFAWFPGGRENWYITQYIVEGMGHLQHLGISASEEHAEAESMLAGAVAFIDREIAEDYRRLQERAADGKVDLAKDHLHHLAVHYLYARSFFDDIPVPEETLAAYNYYQQQAEQFWTDRGIYQQGMIGLALARSSRPEVPQRIIRSLRERALTSREMGMYWKYPRGYWWYELPVETHALMVEFFAEVAKDAEAVDELRVWLLKQKQTTHWKTTKATAAAVYALFNTGSGLAGNWLSADQQVQISFPDLRKKDYEPRIEAALETAEAGTGYFQVGWPAAEISPALSNIRVKNPNPVVAWGSLYWQYFEDLDKITTFEDTPLKLKKQLFRQRPSDTGPVLEAIGQGEDLRPGDLLRVRIELRVDRDMEYVHMKDLRASGLEPVNVLSSYKWQDGLGYYESTGDAATHFFFDYLPQGTYVFEYPLRVAHRGEFSNGLTTIQCMYAPEFSSHSEGVRLQVGRE